MINVAIDISPLSTASKFRGVGMYTKRLIAALQRQENLRVITYEGKEIPTGVDLVHYPYFFPFTLSLPFSSSKKCVVTIHDLIPLVFPNTYPPGIKGKIKFEIQKRNLKKAARIITDSKNSKKDIIHFTSFPAEKIDVVYLAPVEEIKQITDQVFLKDLAAKFKLPKKFVLYVGDVNYNKNLLSLVEACRTVEVPLVLVGRQIVQTDFDQSHIENQSLVQLNKITEGRSDVIKLGFLEEKDLAGVFSLASVYCLPSFYEGFGLSVLEAMAYKCPVVASNVSSIPEIAGEAAVLVDPYNTSQIANGIKSLLDDKNYREKMIKAGLVQAKKFSWEKTARETVKTYEKVLEK